MATDKRSKAERLGARRRGYDAKHEKWRKAVLEANPNCAFCGQPGTPSDHADHIVPIRKGGARWDVRNGQRLHARCHAGPKQAYERTGVMRGCDVSGNPVDGNHHWNA